MMAHKFEAPQPQYMSSKITNCEPEKPRLPGTTNRTPAKNLKSNVQRNTFGYLRDA
jgi:hypothetical protein